MGKDKEEIDALHWTWVCSDCNRPYICKRCFGPFISSDICYLPECECGYYFTGMGENDALRRMNVNDESSFVSRINELNDLDRKLKKQTKLFNAEKEYFDRQDVVILHKALLEAQKTISAKDEEILRCKQQVCIEVEMEAVHNAKALLQALVDEILTQSEATRDEIIAEKLTALRGAIGFLDQLLKEEESD